MGVDHSNAFVRIWFDGLIGFCFTKGSGGQCEMGMVQADDHSPQLLILRVNPNGTTVEHMKRDLRLTDDIRIEAKNPAETGVYTFPRDLASAPFDSAKDIGDPEDFRWTLDLQGDHFHGSKLKLKHARGKAALRPRITIPHGIFYTSDKSPDKFRRIPRKGKTEEKDIGKIGDRLGVDIVCKPKDVSVEITIGSEKPFSLYRDIPEMSLKGVRYWISISNLCSIDAMGASACPDESDFHRFYDVAAPSDGVEYDLQVVYPPEDPRGINPLKNTVAFVGFRSNGPPQVCQTIFFGKSNSIP